MHGVYVHIPFCKKRCNYCAFVSCTDLNKQGDYIAALKSEINLRANGERVDTVYIGGGTPSVLEGGYLTEIFDTLKGAFKIDSSAEITVEANPDSCSKTFVDEAVSCGVNRFSLGLQCADDKFLKKIGRIHTLSDYLNALDALKSKGVNNISTDLILGIEGNTLSDIRSYIDFIAKNELKHVSVYSLQIEKGTPFYNEGVKVDTDLQADMYECAATRLTDYGYNRYEVSNFAKPSYESRHNQKYWQGESYFGFGAAAHSYNQTTRSFNTDDIDLYIKSGANTTVQPLTKNDLIVEYIMLRLRTANGIDLSDFQSKFGYDLLAAKKYAINKYVNLNFLHCTNNCIKLTDSAYYVMNTIIVDLL